MENWEFHYIASQSAANDRISLWWINFSVLSYNFEHKNLCFGIFKQRLKLF